MQNETLKALKDNPHFQELQRYLAAKALEVNTIDGIKRTTAELMAAEVMARQISYKWIAEVLGDLLPVDNLSGGTGSSAEYAVQ